MPAESGRPSPDGFVLTALSRSSAVLRSDPFRRLYRPGHSHASKTSRPRSGGCCVQRAGRAFRPGCPAGNVWQHLPLTYTPHERTHAGGCGASAKPTPRLARKMAENAVVSLPDTGVALLGKSQRSMPCCEPTRDTWARLVVAALLGLNTLLK
jgi:hypothetical protein